MWRKQFGHDLSQLFAIAQYDAQSNSKSHAGHRSFTFPDSNPYQQRYCD